MLCSTSYDIVTTLSNWYIKVSKYKIKLWITSVIMWRLTVWSFTPMHVEYTIDVNSNWGYQDVSEILNDISYVCSCRLVSNRVVEFLLKKVFDWIWPFDYRLKLGYQFQSGRAQKSYRNGTRTPLRAKLRSCLKIDVFLKLLMFLLLKTYLLIWNVGTLLQWRPLYLTSTCRPSSTLACLSHHESYAI